MNYLRTAILLAGLTALFMACGYMIGRGPGMLIALAVAGTMNLISYWKADSLVLAMHSAHQVDERTAPELVGLVAELSRRADLPMPRVFIMDNPQPNAFATGRNPQNAAVAVTSGLLRLLSREEIAGVIAHELGHIKNRDTLTMTITATIAGAISMLAQFAWFFAAPQRNNNDSGNGLGGALANMLMLLLAPIAAMLVQMAISRSREYAADHAGAQISGQPLWLASALAKIDSAARQIDNIPAEQHPATAHLFIVNPLSGARLDNLFSTHPATENRIAALQAMAGASPPRPQWQTSPWDRSRARGPWG